MIDSVFKCILIRMASYHYYTIHDDFIYLLPIILYLSSFAYDKYYTKEKVIVFKDSDGQKKTIILNDNNSSSSNNIFHNNDNIIQNVVLLIKLGSSVLIDYLLKPKTNHIEYEFQSGVTITEIKDE